MEKRVCKNSACGKAFAPSVPKQIYCCVQCREDANKEHKKLNYVRKKKKLNTDLRNIAKEAREMGMSYGQYVAYLKRKE